MPIRTDPRFIGRASITPDGPVVAGSFGTWAITYEVGAYAYDERARIKIASRFASDWGRPQFTDPRAAEYCTVRLETTCDTAVASLAFEPRGQVLPWFKCLVVSVADGSLYPGDRVHVTIGDRSGGAPRPSARRAASGASSSTRSAPSSTPSSSRRRRSTSWAALSTGWS